MGKSHRFPGRNFSHSSAQIMLLSHCIGYYYTSYVFSSLHNLITSSIDGTSPRVRGHSFLLAKQMPTLNSSHGCSDKCRDIFYSRGKRLRTETLLIVRLFRPNVPFYKAKERSHRQKQEQPLMELVHPERLMARHISRGS